MKRIKIFLAGILVTLSIRAAQAQYTRASLQAAGLTCSMCSKATEKALQTLPFVATISPDLNTNTFLLTFHKGVPVSLDALRAKVEAAGFSVAKLTVTADFDHVHVGTDTHINYQGNILHFVGVKDQVLNGPEKITVIDKGFLPEKGFKKFEAIEKMPCFRTGKVDGSCCHVDGKTNSDRVYHVTI